ncbi:MAG: Zn-dependent alcohol dehydrogenase [Pseudomonadota bacterium]
MKAAICREFGKPLTIEEVTLSEPNAGEVRVKLKACSICHSDVSFADGIWGGTLPAVYGHEGAGIVQTVGDNVPEFVPGDHVIVTLVRHCSDCHYCHDGVEVLCETDFPLNTSAPITNNRGNEIHQAMNCGAFAEEVVVHHSQLQKAPETMPFDVACLIACGVITGYGAVRHASNLRQGQTAIIIGCGGVGLNSVQGAKLAGAAKIIAMDLETDKLQMAKKLGATHGINPTDKDAVEQIMAITDGRGADCVFVTVGVKAAIDSAQNYITKNGTVVIVGMPSSDTRGDYDPGTMAAWGQKIIGTKMGNSIIAEDIPEIISLYAKGEYQLDPLISGRFKLEDVNEALDGVRSGKAVKNVIVFD